MSPSVISTVRLTIRRAVVLPLPDGPTSTQISPAGTSSESSWIAGSAWPGYRLVTLLKETDAAWCPGSTEAMLLPRRTRHSPLAGARQAGYHPAAAERARLFLWLRRQR